MSEKEMQRLTEWLKLKGKTKEEVEAEKAERGRSR